MDFSHIGPMYGNIMLRPPTSSAKFSHTSQFHHRRRTLLVSAVPTSNSASRLRDPARIGGVSKSIVPVHDYGGAASLSAYMHLPPSHYSALDPDLIESLGGNKFRLRVPRLKLFSLWVEPTVDISVSSASSTDPRVLLTSESCHIVGSELIQKMQLDQRFILKFSTELTWKAAALSTKSTHPTVITTNKLSESQINANLELEVLTEVIPPFQLLPRSVLEGTCNAVLRSLMKTLLPKFLHKLANDYTKWATDADYRLGRTLAEEAGVTKM
ncbi:hypothetical protein NADE_004505 [Nannochloris sp. 'desiccata']|nr:hypothetical protein NADE_004505 [Chlorella desiccata (nom. nud.)]